MKKNQLTKWLLMPALAASVAVGGTSSIVPSFAQTNVVYAASSAQTQLNQFAKHYATFYKQYVPKSDRIEASLEKITEDNFVAFIKDYDAFLIEFDTFLTENFTYGSNFNADLIDIEAFFYDALLAEFNAHVALYNYLIDEVSETEYNAIFAKEQADYTASMTQFKTSLNAYKTTHRVSLPADVYYLLNEQAPVTPPTETVTTHTVKKDETLYSIAKKYNLTVAELKQLNNLKKDTLSIGQKLKVKTDATIKPTTPSKPETTTSVTYKVKKGDNLSKIAKTYGMTVAELKQLNGLKNDNIQVGQTLKVKKDASVKPTTPTKTTTKVVTAASLNVRSSASTQGKVLGSLKKNAKVEVVSTSNGWAKINYGKGHGYVSLNYLKDVPKASTPVATPNKGVKTHTVKKDDTLYKLSKTYHVSVADLKKWNGLKNDNIHVGQKLKLSK